MVSALTCVRDDSNGSVNVAPTHVYINNLASGGAMICPIPDDSDLPSTAITGFQVKVTDQEWGTPTSDKEFATKACFKRGWLGGGCGATSSSLGTGTFTLTPSASQMANTVQSIDVSYLYVDLPDYVTSTQISYFNGYFVFYP